jgi:hypothetical protein
MVVALTPSSRTIWRQPRPCPLSCSILSSQQLGGRPWHYPNQLAGVLSTHQATGGDINEALSSLWFHDHRVMFTSQNTYKGLLGLCCIFNQFDTGDEGTGFHLPSFPEFDIPMAFQDKVFDPETGLLAFDLFNLDGILGDKFLTRHSRNQTGHSL